jgi:hypothetical protein
VYVFLSNRVFSSRGNNLLSQLNIRGKVQDAIYHALEADKLNPEQVREENIAEEEEVLEEDTDENVSGASF